MKVKSSIIVFFAALLFLSACKKNIKQDSISLPAWTENDRTFLIKELDRTTNEVMNELKNLSINQWNFHEEPSRWSILEITEHLEMQNQLHFRELSVTSNAPKNLQFRTITEGKDSFFIKYGTDPKKGTAKWFLEPKGKYCTPESAREAFIKARQELTNWVKNTELDLRMLYTYRTSMEGKDVSKLEIGQVRDLHQLLLTGIAHTDRHLKQIKKIKFHENFPQ